MELVTGRKGSPHVTSQQDRMLNQGIFGQGAYILNTGQNLEPQVQTSNEIRIRDGAIMAQGALGCVKVNTYDSVTIQNGNQGMKRIDLICWQYSYDAEQDVESAEWVVIQGTPVESDPQQPTYTSGNIQEGDALVQIPVFAVNIDGINVTGVDILLDVAMDMSTANAYLAQLRANSISEIGNNYIKYADGRLEQWGIVSVSYTDGYGIINFPVTFAGTDMYSDYQVFVQPRYISSTYGYETLTVQKMNMATTYVYSRRIPDMEKVQTHSVDWRAYGRWK